MVDIKKTLLITGMVLCILGIFGVLATSYFNSSGNQIITADQAVILSLGESTSVEQIILSEDALTRYNVTATVQKSAGVSNVNATLTFDFTDLSVDKTLASLTFSVYAVEGDTLLSSLQGEGVLTVTDINQTGDYYILIELTEKPNGERYTADELANIAGKLTISFTSTAGGGVNA